MPIEIRRALDLQVGDSVAVSLDEDGTLHAELRPVRSVADMTFGSIRPRTQPEETATLREHFMEAAQERDERTRQRP